jgi:hypothetical protein
MMAGSLNGRPSDVQRASQPMHDQGQGSTSPTAHAHEDAQNHSRASKSRSDSLRSSCRVVWKRALVGRERDLQMCGPSIPAPLASLINPVRPPHDANGHAYNRIRAHTCTSSSGLQAAPIHREARKRVRRLQTQGSARPPHIWGTDMQSYQKGTQARPGRRDHALA